MEKLLVWYFVPLHIVLDNKEICCACYILLQVQSKWWIVTANNCGLLSDESRLQCLIQHVQKPWKCSSVSWSTRRSNSTYVLIFHMLKEKASLSRHIMQNGVECHNRLFTDTLDLWLIQYCNITSGGIVSDKYPLPHCPTSPKPSAHINTWLIFPRAREFSSSILLHPFNSTPACFKVYWSIGFCLS